MEAAAVTNGPIDNPDADVPHGQPSPAGTPPGQPVNPEADVPHGRPLDGPVREAGQPAANMSIAPVDYRIEPSRYRHWSIQFDGPVATLSLNIDEDAGIRPGYKLKLNSYDLGVDIELNDAVNRIRFEHPEVRTVVMTSLKDRIFCSGANIFMLGVSSHAWKVNFCKFTHEPRNGLED